MLVAVSMPYERNRWFLFAFGVLGNNNTCIFRHPLSCERSWRLFLRFLIPHNEAVTDDKTGIPVRVSSHATRSTSYQRSAIGVAFCWFPCSVAGYKAMATHTLSASVPGIDPTGENTRVVGFVLAVVEDTSLHPISPFVVTSFAVLALGRFEVPKVFKHKDSSLVRLRKLNNTSAHNMSEMFINVANLVPKLYIVLFILCKKRPPRNIMGKDG